MRTEEEMCATTWEEGRQFLRKKGTSGELGNNERAWSPSSFNGLKMIAMTPEDPALLRSKHLPIRTANGPEGWILADLWRLRWF